MIKYRALIDVEIGKRVVSWNGSSVISRLPEGSNVQASLLGWNSSITLKEIPVRMRDANGLDSRVSLPDYYPCRYDRVLRKKILKDHNRARPAWALDVDRSKKGGRMAVKNNEKKIANWTKWTEEQEVKYKEAKKAKNEKRMAKFRAEADYGHEMIAKFKAPSVTGKGVEKKTEGVVVMLKYV